MAAEEATGLGPQLNPQLLEGVDEEIQQRFKKNAYLVNQSKELVQESQPIVDKKVARAEVKKSAKILRSDVLKKVMQEANEEPEEVHHNGRDRVKERLERHGFGQDDAFRKQKLTNKQKRELNIKGNMQTDEFTDFTEMNDIKAIFGKEDGSRGHRDVRQKKKVWKNGKKNK